MKKSILAALTVLIFFSCKEHPKSWQLSQMLEIEGVNSIGITHRSDGIWLSDGDHHRVVRIDENGEITETIDSLDRPMHIATNGDELLIPQYGNDEVLRWKENVVKIIAISDSLDAPAGVWRDGKETVIADFYNHRILYSEDGVDWKSFGSEGKENGQFNYPTDVQLFGGEIWVADAYNNRVQVFDKSGTFLKKFGEADKLNAATGIFVSKEQVFVTDFENNRVVIYDHEGILQQELSENIEKPTDMVLVDGKLYVANYKNNRVNIYDWKEDLNPKKSKNKEANN